ncbi:MAG TPA: ATP-binding cassette domain-containing protein [Desulfatirhabdiaceae bacterium]|nr:ATP-binding cassette domain-containing protein [Desulfatirhabdiaceae bacterium]
MTQTASRHAIVAETIYKRFGQLEVLKGVSLSADEGNVIALIGSSGSGKSTLLRCINLLETPDSGNVYISGELIRMKKNRRGETVPEDNKQVDRIRTRLGMVFQHFNLWSHMTILENVIEAPVHVMKKPKKYAIDLAMTLLEKVGIDAKAHFYPSQLSGGQQQRAAIARALAVEPAALLVDEPTSALDPELVGEVLRVMQQLAEEGRTMIIATHEMEFARQVSSHVMFLHNGVVEDQGPPEYLFENPSSERCRQFLSGIIRK